MYLRKKFVSEILQKVDLYFTTNSRANSVLLRGPRASGKSVLLNILASTLMVQYKECLVYLILDSNINVSTTDFKRIVEEAGAKKVFFLFDEVHKNPYAPFWTFLLKNAPSNVFVIAAGVETFNSSSVNFVIKFESSRMMLNEAENIEIVYFWKKKYPHIILVSEIATYLLAYTGGHLYPYLKLCEFIFSEAKLYSDIESVCVFLNSAHFLNTPVYEDIFSRCFDNIPSKVLIAAQNMYNSVLTTDNIDNFNNYGYWNIETGKLISILLNQILFSLNLKNLFHEKKMVLLHNYNKMELEVIVIESLLNLNIKPAVFM